MENGTKVRIIAKTRKGEIGTYIAPEKTIIGTLHRIEFNNDSQEAGLYSINDFVEVY